MPIGVGYDGRMSNALATATLAPETVLIYARVSHDPKYKGESVDRQIELGKQWATLNGYGIGRVKRDDNRSASRTAKRVREGWEEVKRIIATPNRPETILWTWEDTRATRDMAEFLPLASLCQTHDMPWAFNGRVYDLNDSDGEFFATMGIALAQREVKKISERAMGGIMTAAENGNPRGRTPYGYQRVYEPGVKSPRLEIHEPEAIVIREAAHRFLSGESLRSIAKDFEAREFPTPIEAQSIKEREPVTARYGWREYMIRRLLANPVMNGKRRLTLGQGNGKAPIVTTHDAQWDSIIDDVTFARVQGRLADPSRKVVRQRESARLLTGVARCGVCEGPMGFAVKRSDGNERGIYSCRYGNHVSRHQRPLELLVTSFLIEHMRGSNIGIDDPSPELSSVREQRARIDRDLLQYVALVKSGDLNPLDYAAVTNALRDERRRLDAMIRVANIPTVAVEMSESVDPEEYWDRLSKTESGREQQRDILRAMLMVKVYPVSKPGSHHFEPETIEIIPR